MGAANLLPGAKRAQCAIVVPTRECNFSSFKKDVKKLESRRYALLRAVLIFPEGGKGVPEISNKASDN